MTSRNTQVLSPIPTCQPAPKKAARTWLSSKKQPLQIAAVFLLMIALWWYADQWYKERLQVEQRAQAISELSARSSALSSAVNRRLARLQGLHAFVSTEGSEPDFAQTFEQFSADLFAGSRGIRNLAVAPAGEIRYVFPREGNEAVLGYQPLVDPRPEVVADVQRAIDTERIILSGPLELIQGGLGLIARQAVYQDGQYWGLVNLVLDVDPLLTETGIKGGSGDLKYALRNSQGQIFYGSPATFSSSPIISQIILPDGYWELAGIPGDGWFAQIRQPLYITRIGSLISVVLLTSLVYLTLNRQSRLSEAVEDRTRELSAANTLLEQRVEERTLELTMLLNISRSISSTLELDVLLQQVLDKLLPVVDFTGGAILSMEDDVFVVWAYQGPIPQESTLHRSYSLNNIIGRQLIEEKKPVLIPDVLENTPLALAFRQATRLHHDHASFARSWMGVPLIAREEVIGMLALHHREPEIYDQGDVDMAMAFSNHVAVAIENARLHEKAQRLAVLQERQRLARELHDSVSQALYGIALGTRTARSLLDRLKLNEDSKEILSEPLNYILSLSEGGLAEMRALIFELRPESLEREGLVAALTRQLNALEARHNIKVNNLQELEPDVSLTTKEVLLRVSQEALHNIVKHSEATKVTARLALESEHLALEILDNGKGFDLNGDFAGHLGLRSMRERVEQIGGSLTIISSTSKGTLVTAAVPLDLEKQYQQSPG